MAERVRRGLALVMSFLALGSAAAAAPQRLEIYFINVEGGQATLLVTPSRQSFLIDAGWAGKGARSEPGNPRQARDANRIAAAAADAGIRQIDYLLITHFHPDHDGGVRDLSQLMPIQMFIDHGTASIEAIDTSAETKEAYNEYLGVRAHGRHLVTNVGEQLPLVDINVSVVSSAGAVLRQPLDGAGTQNADCPDHGAAPRDPYENPRSTGVVVQYGKFRFLDVGDLTGEPLYDLVCPRDLIGRVDAYLVAHHGGPDVMVSETFAAWRPRITIMNNGLNKGGARVTYQALRGMRGLEDVWQLEPSTEAGAANFPSEYIANFNGNTAFWIKLVASKDGSFRVFNARTGSWKNYPRLL